MSQHSQINPTFFNNSVLPDIPLSPRRPSDYWLRNPAWIGKFLNAKYCNILLIGCPDGCLDPPHFYIDQEEIDNARRAAGHLPQFPMVPQQVNTVAPVVGSHYRVVPDPVLQESTVAPVISPGKLPSITLHTN